MFLEKTQKIINAFQRYVSNDSERRDYHKLSAYEDKEKVVVEFFIEDYSLIAWIDESHQPEELHIVSSTTGESVFDYANERGWTKETVDFIKYGNCLAKEDE